MAISTDSKKIMKWGLMSDILWTNREQQPPWLYVCACISACVSVFQSSIVKNIAQKEKHNYILAPLVVNCMELPEVNKQPIVPNTLCDISILSPLQNRPIILIIICNKAYLLLKLKTKCFKLSSSSVHFNLY